MPPGGLRRELERIGKMVLRWRAQLKSTFCAAGIVVFVWIFSLSDLYIQLGRVARFATWFLLVAGGVATIWWMKKTMSRRVTPVSAAANVEKAFPSLDNHLINFLQFSEDRTNNPFMAAYIKKGAPNIRKFDLKKMRNSKAHRNAVIVLFAALMILGSPVALVGKAWPVAVWRVVNPFTSTLPLSMTKILSVDPGDATVLQGKPLMLTCNVQGKKGHKVWVDVHPNDGEETVYSLGTIKKKNEEEEFTYRVQKVTTGIKYRFRAGDAPFPKQYVITPRPPPAFTSIKLKIKAPKYTKLADQEVDGLSEGTEVAQGSEIVVNAECNTKLTKLTVFTRGYEKPIIMTKVDGDGMKWKQTLEVREGSSLKLDAITEFEDKLDSVVAFMLLPDRPPVIEIISPKGRSLLPAGAMPKIEFAAADDYGIADVSIERVAAKSSRESAGDILKQWDANGQKDYMQNWQGSPQRVRGNPTFSYRIIVKDNCPFEQHTTRSAKITFNGTTGKAMIETKDEMEAKAYAMLSKVIDLQKKNISKTKVYKSSIDQATKDQWKDVVDRQTEVKRLTKEILKSPLKPLGNLTESVKKLYANEISEVIPVLKTMTTQAGSQDVKTAQRGLHLEQKILRKLTYADVAAAGSKVERKITALGGMIDALVKGQTLVLGATQKHIKTSTKVTENLIDQQDDLTMDLSDFVKLCKKEAEQLENNEPTFATLLLDLAKAINEKKIRNDMLMASERLDGNNPAGAKPHEQQSLLKLREIQKLLLETTADMDEEERLEMLEAIQEAKIKMAKVDDMMQKIQEQMDSVRGTKDKDDKDSDMLEEEYKELLKKAEKSMLEIPTDLHIFTDLNVANDAVEDVFSVFEEHIVSLEAGGEGADGNFTERAPEKREEYLAKMEEAMGRMDDMESWLGESAEKMKITPEPFDIEEMPASGVALGELSTEAEDLIGDLIKESEADAEEGADGAVNTAVPDMEASDEVKEGDVTSFAAKGKSGNEAPDHKEQDGRSNVGRQGMANGENASGGGTIGEGDKNLEERRTESPTQSGQVDVDGEADTKATGGGKLGSGKADGFGMAGGKARMDSKEAGSSEGQDALEAERVDAMYASASAKGVKSDSLRDAAHHLRQAADCEANGNIQQMKEFRRNALAALKKAKTELSNAAKENMNDKTTVNVLDDVVQGSPEEAPPRYRGMVSAYYKALNDEL